MFDDFSTESMALSAISMAVSKNLRLMPISAINWWLIITYQAVPNFKFSHTFLFNYFIVKCLYIINISLIAEQIFGVLTIQLSQSIRAETLSTSITVANQIVACFGVIGRRSTSSFPAKHFFGDDFNLDVHGFGNGWRCRG